MARNAFTLRHPDATRAALESLSRIERRPINQLVTEAVDVYLQRTGAEEQRLTASLEALRRYRQRDPEFHRAVASFCSTTASTGIPEL